MERTSMIKTPMIKTPMIKTPMIKTPMTKIAMTKTPMTKIAMTKTPSRSIRIVSVGALALMLGASLVGCSSDTKATAKKAKAKVSTTSTTAIAAAPTPSGATGATGNGQNSGGQNSSGQNSGGQTSGGGSPAPAPTINSFDTPENIDCHNGNLQNFTASWSTANAANVTISIDGPGIYNTYPATGSTSLPFNCSSSHTFLLTAFGQDGTTTTKTVTLDPRNVQTTTPDPADQP